MRGKGGKTRIVWTHPMVWAAVQRRPPGPIATCTAQSLSNHSRRYLRRIGLPGVTLHRFRAWFATWLLRPTELGGAGAELGTVSKLMGHSSPDVTMVYAEISGEQLQMAVSRLPALTTAAV